jgi:hypothetical protein
MCSLCFAFGFQVVQIAPDRRLTDIEGRAKVRDRNEALAADKLPQLRPSLIRRLTDAQNLPPQTLAWMEFRHNYDSFPSYVYGSTRSCATYFT